MAIQTHAAAQVGLGTVELTGTLASQALPSIPDRAKAAIVFVMSGTLYVENDGTVADATNAMPYGTGGVASGFVVENSRKMLRDIRIFSSAAVTIKVQYAS